MARCQLSCHAKNVRRRKNFLRLSPWQIHAMPLFCQQKPPAAYNRLEFLNDRCLPDKLFQSKAAKFLKESSHRMLSNFWALYIVPMDSPHPRRAIQTARGVRRSKFLVADQGGIFVENP